MLDQKWSLNAIPEDRTLSCQLTDTVFFSLLYKLPILILFLFFKYHSDLLSEIGSGRMPSLALQRNAPHGA